jgi:hypothetical protein
MDEAVPGALAGRGGPDIAANAGTSPLFDAA